MARRRKVKLVNPIKFKITAAIIATGTSPLCWGSSTRARAATQRSPGRRQVCLNVFQGCAEKVQAVHLFLSRTLSDRCNESRKIIGKRWVYIRWQEESSQANTLSPIRGRKWTTIQWYCTCTYGIVTPYESYDCTDITATVMWRWRIPDSALRSTSVQ